MNKYTVIRKEYDPCVVESDTFNLMPNGSLLFFSQVEESKPPKMIAIFAPDVWHSVLLEAPVVA